MRKFESISCIPFFLIMKVYKPPNGKKQYHDPLSGNLPQVQGFPILVATPPPNKWREGGHRATGPGQNGKALPQVDAIL